ncbi:MAG: tetratricopeptide repeat protein [Blastocatellia bacterium]
MTPNWQRLKFFCLVHGENCFTQRASPLPMCEQGPHSLTEDFLHDKWEYCCACESFYTRKDHEPARSKCPSCERQIVARYLCENCNTFSFETGLPPPRRSFAFTDAGAPHPACPCCMVKTPALALEHRCSSLRSEFRTALPECPFCGESVESVPTRPPVEELPAQRVKPIEFISSFEKPVREYLQRMNGVASKASPASAQPYVLIEQPEGIFWLTKFRDDHAFIVFPGLTHWNGAWDFGQFQAIFECDNPSAGEVLISAPAVAYFSPDQCIWTVTQKGRLKIQPEQPQASPVVTPSPSSFPTLSPDQAPPSSKLAGKKIPLITGAAVLAIIAGLGIYFLFASPKRQIISKVKQGNIVTPAGASAYDIFVKSSLGESDLAEIRREITPLLEANGNEVIRQLVSDGYNPSATDCDNTAKIFGWLDTLSPQNSHKARKLYFQGRTAFERQDLSGAENEFRQAMNYESSWALPVNHMGRIAVRRKDYANAQNWYQRAGELEPNWMAPKINRCVVAVENLKDYVMGQDACQAVLNLDSNKASGYYFLGRAFEGRGYRCEALGQYRAAQGMISNPTSPGFNIDSLNRRVNQLARQCGG